jgi:transposase
MHFNPEAVACRHGNSKTIPKRRFRRRVGVCCPVAGARSRRRSTAQPRLARGVQWTEVDRAHRLCLALYATRLAAVGSRLSADEKVAGGWRTRGDGPRFARTLLATFGGQSARSDGDHTGLPHPAIHAGERLSGRLRRGERKKGTKVHAAVDTLGHLLASHVTPADEQEREHVGELAETVQEATGESVELAHVDQGYTGERPATDAETHGMRLEVVKHEEAKRGFVLLPRRLCGGAGFRMGITISTAGEGLREAARRFGGSALCRLRLPLPPAGDRHPRRGFITHSRPSSS